MGSRRLVVGCHRAGDEHLRPRQRPLPRWATGWRSAVSIRWSSSGRSLKACRPKESRVRHAGPLRAFSAVNGLERPSGRATFIPRGTIFDNRCVPDSTSASVESPGGRRTLAASSAVRSTKRFRELLVRWFQYGHLLPAVPTARLAKQFAGAPRIERPDPGRPQRGMELTASKCTGSCASICFLRERLRPYIMEQMLAGFGEGVSADASTVL